jgi:hypothetical protein
MKNRIFFLSFVASLILTTRVNGQSDDEGSGGGFPLEAFVHGNLGSSGANYTTSSTKLGGNLGLGAVYSFDKNWGVITGAELAFYNSDVSNRNLVNSIDKASLLSGGAFPDYRSAYGQSSMVGGNNFAYGIDMMGYREDYTSIFVNVPLMARYMNQLTITSQETSAAGYAGRYTSEHKMYISAGVKLAIPLSAKVTSHVNNLVIDGMPWTTGWTWNEFVALNPDAVDLAQTLGFGTFTGKVDGVTKTLQLNFGVALALEAGYSYPLNDNVVLCGGVYFDYGLTTLYTRDRNTPVNMIVVPREPTVSDPQSLIVNNQAMVSQRLNNIAVGIVIRASMNMHLFNGDNDELNAPKSIEFSSKVLGY